MDFDANYHASTATVRSNLSYTSTKTLPGKSSYTVYLLDGQPVQIQIDRKSTGRDLFDECCLNLSPPIEEKDYFSLSFDVMEHGKEVRTWIDFTKPVAKQMVNAKHKALAMNVKFYPPDPTQLLEYTRYLFYLQLRDDLCKGKMPCAFNTLALLGSYVCQADVGDYTQDMDFDILYSFPFGPDENSPELVNKIMELWQSHAGLSTAESEMNYIENAKKLPMYGTDLHPATDSDNIDIDIGINYSGVLVFRNKVRINRIVWPKILKISYKRDYFYVRVRPAENDRYEKTIGFKMEGYKAAKRVWKICIEHHAFFRLVRPDPRSKKLKFGSKPNLTFQTEYQVKKSATLRSDYQTFDRYGTLGSNKSGSLTRGQSRSLNRRALSVEDILRTPTTPGGQDYVVKPNFEAPAKFEPNGSAQFQRDYPPNDRDGYLTRIGLFTDYPENQQEAPNAEQPEDPNRHYQGNFDQRFPEDQPGMRYPEDEQGYPEGRLNTKLSANKFGSRISHDLTQNPDARYDVEVSGPNYPERELDGRFNEPSHGAKISVDSRLPLERAQGIEYSQRLPEGRQEFEFEREPRLENRGNEGLNVNAEFDPRFPEGSRAYQGPDRHLESQFSTNIDPKFDLNQEVPELTAQKSVEVKAPRMSLGFWNRSKKNHDDPKRPTSPESPQNVEAEAGSFNVGVNAEADLNAKQRKPLLPFMKRRDKSRDKSKPEKEEKDKKSKKKGKHDLDYDVEVSPEIPPRPSVDADPSFDVQEDFPKPPFEENLNKPSFKSSFERLQEMGAVQASFPKMGIRGDIGDTERSFRNEDFDQPRFSEDRRHTDSPTQMEYSISARPEELPRGFRTSPQGPDRPVVQTNRDLVRDQLRERYEKQSSLNNDMPEMSRSYDKPSVPEKPMGIYSRSELSPRNFPNPRNDAGFSGRVVLPDQNPIDFEKPDARINFEVEPPKLDDRPNTYIKPTASQFAPKDEEIPPQNIQFDPPNVESSFTVPQRPAYNEARRNFFASKPQKIERPPPPPPPPQVNSPVVDFNERNLTPLSAKKQPPAVAPKPKRLMGDRNWNNERAPEVSTQQQPENFMQELKNRFDLKPLESNSFPSESEDEMNNPSAANSAHGTLELKTANLKLAPAVPDKPRFNFGQPPVVSLDREYEVGVTPQGGRYQYEKEVYRSTSKDERTVSGKPGTDLSDIFNKEFRVGTGSSLTNYTYKSETVTKTTTMRGHSERVFNEDDDEFPNSVNTRSGFQANFDRPRVNIYK